MNLTRLDWIIKKANAAESRLTDWERKFIDDLERRRAAGHRMMISDRMEEVLERIAESCA